VVLSEDAVRRLHGARDRIQLLDEYRSFLISCGGYVGPYVRFDGLVVGLRLDLGSDDLPELPEFLDFLAIPKKLVLAVANPKALGSRGDFRFYYLTQLTLAISHHLPFVPSTQPGQVLSFGEQCSIQPSDKQITVRTVEYRPADKRAVVELAVSNRTDQPIYGLEAYFFGQPPKAFPRSHGWARFISRVNTVGPFAGLHFGNLAPGDSIARRLEYDLSFGSTVAVSWTPRLLRQDDGDGGGGGFGNGCTTTKPEPIPDEFAKQLYSLLAGGCFDAGCSLGGD
jgi:hypothetical protein